MNFLPYQGLYLQRPLKMFDMGGSYFEHPVLVVFGQLSLCRSSSAICQKQTGDVKHVW